MFLYIILILIPIFIFYLFLYLVSNKINKLELKIDTLFQEKNNLIPSLYDITQKNINKHNMVFSEILKLRKKAFNENKFINDFNIKINTYSYIHNELNFIFNVSAKHSKLLKEEKFLFLRDLIIKKNHTISKKLELYRMIIQKYNTLILFKNLTII